MRKAKSFLLGLSLAFVAFAAPAQTVQKGTVTGEDAVVFQSPDFDSPIIASVRQGDVYDMSVGKKGAFYKIRLKPGTTGWISDADIRPGVGRVHKKKPEKKQKKGLFSEPVKDVPEHDELSSSRSMNKKRYRGPMVEFINFREDTMGGTYDQANMMFFGFKWSGNNTLIDGPMYIDSEVLFHQGAPDYYSKATNVGSGGFALIANMLFETEEALSREDMYFFGFGPSFKFTHFEVGLLKDPTVGKTRTYSLDDMTLGAVFNLGYAHAFESSALRFDYRYYWESTRYFALGLAFQFDF